MRNRRKHDQMNTKGFESMIAPRSSSTGIFVGSLLAIAFFYVLVFLILSGCGGRDEGDNNSTQTSSKRPGGVVISSVVVSDEAIVTDGSGAMFYAAKADVPDCDETNQRALVYVKEIRHFQYCDDTEWVFIDIQGPQGVAGKDGKDGQSGKDGSNGIAGSNGTNGVNGTNGTDGEDGSIQVWRHPVNNTEWFLGQGFNYTSLLFAASISQLCPQGSRIPTDAEYSNAILSGAWNQFGPILSGISGADLRILLEQVGVPFNYNLRLGEPGGSIGTQNANSLNTNKSVYPLCVVVQ